MSSWSDLPQELLGLIFQATSYDFKDLCQCLRVCSSWRSVAKELCRKITGGTPLLLFSHYRSPYNRLLFDTCLVYGKNLDYGTNMISSLVCNINNRMMVYSSHRGWLLFGFFDSTSLISVPDCHRSSIYLYNPISRIRLQLPPLPYMLRLRGCRIKFITSTSPTDPNCIVFAMWECSRYDFESPILAFCKLDESKPCERWNILNKPWLSHSPLFEDMIFYKGQFCTITDNGEFSIYYDDSYNVLTDSGINVVCPRMNQTMFDNRASSRKFYLVESKIGKLLMVERVFQSTGTINMRVFELNLSKKEWEEVSSFEGGGDQQALFLAWNEPMFVPITNHGVFKPNCIYFIDEYWRDKNIVCGLFVYDLGNRTIENFNPKLQFTPEVTHSLWFRPDMSCPVQ